MKLKLYMKSGNVIIIKGIKDIHYKYIGNEITALTVEWTWLAKKFSQKRGVLLKSVDLSQIECMEVV
jgi:hypothetical protein